MVSNLHWTLVDRKRHLGRCDYQHLDDTLYITLYHTGTSEASSKFALMKDSLERILDWAREAIRHDCLSLPFYISTLNDMYNTMQEWHMKAPE